MFVPVLVPGPGHGLVFPLVWLSDVVGVKLLAVPIDLLTCMCSVIMVSFCINVEGHQGNS